MSADERELLNNNDNNINNGNQNQLILIQRPAYSLKKFRDEFAQTHDDDDRQQNTKKNWSRALRVFASAHLNPLKLFAIINLFLHYKVKECLVPDILSGITVGVMNIPAALAYGALTSLNPVHGLYTSFYCGLAYVLFGTSKQLSVGTFAVVSLMVYSTITQIESELQEVTLGGGVQSNNFTFSPNSTQLESANENKQILKVKIATALTFWCGSIQIFFSILGLGRVSKYMPQSLLRGFTTAAAFHVFSSQIRHVFGIYVQQKQKHNMFKLFFVYFRIFQNISLINWAAFVMSTSAVVILVLVKIQINERFRKQLRNIPLPIELVVIIISILITHFTKLDKVHNLAIIGQIPKGLAQPSLPEFSLVLYVLKDAFIISIIAFTTSVSVADLYARKHKYQINSNQEFLALGVANVIGSFFKCFVSCGSLARSAVLESSGGKTQMVTIVASGVVLAVMVWLSPVLESLPKAILSSIIISALINLFKQLKDIAYYWRVDRLECLIWLVTFAGCIILDVDFGLGIGVITVLFVNTYRSQNLELIVVGQIEDTEIFVDAKEYRVASDSSAKFLVVRPTRSIFYVNCDSLRESLNSILPLKSSTLQLKKSQKDSSSKKCTSSCCSNNEEAEDRKKRRDEALVDVRVVVLDLTSVEFLDDAGFKILKQCIQEYKSDGVRLVLANCNQHVLGFLQRMQFATDDTFISVRDAIELLSHTQ